MAHPEETARQLTCRKLDKGDLPQVIEFIKNYFTPRVPTVQIFKANARSCFMHCAARATAMIGDGASFGIFDQSGNMVRLDMAVILEKGKEFSLPAVDCEECLKQKSIVRFIEYLEGDYFADLDAAKVMELCITTCHPDYCGKALWKEFKVLEQQELCAAQNGCEYVVSGTVSHYTQLVLHRAGFRVMREVEFSDYVDPLTGKKPDLALSSVHTSAMYMYKRVEGQLSCQK